MLALKQGSVPDVIANKLDHLLILTSGTEQYLITCTNKKYKFLLTTTLTISVCGIYFYAAAVRTDRKPYFCRFTSGLCIVLHDSDVLYAGKDI